MTLKEGRKRIKNGNGEWNQMDLFDPKQGNSPLCFVVSTKTRVSQDIKDEVCCDPNFGVEKFQEDLRNDFCFMFVTVNYGDGARTGLYMQELYELEAVKEWETYLLVRFKNIDVRAQNLMRMMKDVMLTKKLDRFYLVDEVMEWNQNWAMDIAKALKLTDEHRTSRVIRLSGAPRSLERDCIVQMEDTMKLMNVEAPIFAPKDYTHALFCVEMTFEEKKFIGYSLAEKELFYSKPPDKTGEWDKISRAYFKLYEAAIRFKVDVKGHNSIYTNISICRIYLFLTLTLFTFAP